MDIEVGSVEVGERMTLDVGFGEDGTESEDVWDAYTVVPQPSHVSGRQS